MQEDLIPNSLPNTKKLKITSSYMPHFALGGDYYDYIPLSQDKFLICIADVSGKGIPAACLLYTSPSPRDKRQSRMPSSA